MNKKIAFASFLLVCWAAILAYIALASVPLNPASLKFENKMNILSVVPEGWGFFTRDAREPAIHVYKKENAGYSLVNYPMPDWKNGLGVSRNMRKINIELFSLLAAVQDSSWQTDTTGRLSFDCDTMVTLKGPFNHSRLRGTFLVVKQERLPWAWAGQWKTITMPYKKLLLNIY